MRVEYIELRRDPRINTDVEVSYSIEPLTLNGGADPLQAVGVLTDLGDGGAGLITDRPHYPQQTVRVHGIGETQQTREGTVRWVRKARERYRIGVEFKPANR